MESIEAVRGINMDKRVLTFILAGILILSCMTLVVQVQAAPQHQIVLPFSTGWENLDFALGRRDSVDYREDFSSPQLGWVDNEVGPPDVFGYEFGSRQLKAAGRFDSSYSYCYFNLFDMTPDSDWGPPIKIRPYTFINIWYRHEDLAHCMIDAQLYNKGTQQYWTLRDFNYNGEYIVDQNGVRIHPACRWNDTIGSWQFASFDLSIIYESDPENWYITKIWIAFDNDPSLSAVVKGPARTYFDMLYISYGAGNREITTFDDSWAYCNAWTTGSIIARRYDRDPDYGTYGLELKVAISAFNDGYTKDEYGNPLDYIRPYKLRVSTTAGEAEFLRHPVPTGLNLTQPDPEVDEVAELVLDALAIIASSEYAPVGYFLDTLELATVFLALLKMPDPGKKTYEWPHGVGWYTYELPYYALPKLMQGEVCLKISGLSSGELHTIPITFEVDYCYPHYDPMCGWVPVDFMTESFTLNIEWTSTPDDVDLPPETPSTPSGPPSGYPGITYAYDTNTTDPEGDDVKYEFNWGDGTPNTITGWYDSGETATVSHHWASPGTYEVKVRARDSEHDWGSWSPSLTVNIIDHPPQPPPAQEHRYIVMGGVTTTCGQHMGFDPNPWFENVRPRPFHTRPPGLTPMLMGQNITFSDPDPETGVVYLTVPAETYVGLDHIFFNSSFGYYFRHRLIMECDGYGWVFTGEGIDPILGDVDCYTFSTDTGTYWDAPGDPYESNGQPAGILSGFPSFGPDCVAGTADDGFGDGTLDPPGSSILYLPTTLDVDYFDGATWVDYFEAPWPQVWTTAVAYNIVTEPASAIDGVSSTVVGKPWEFLAGIDHPEYNTVLWNHNFSNAYVTYVCAWSVLNVNTGTGDLDIHFKVEERLVREDCVIADINGNEQVDIVDVVICSLAQGAEDEKFGNPKADSNFDARGDVSDARGMIDIVDTVKIAINFGWKLTPNCILK